MSETRMMNRRRFLKIAGGAVGFATLSCVGVGLVGTHQPKVEKITSSCSGTQSSRLLVTYASRAGSTAGIAAAIGDTLCESGKSVDVRPVSEVEDVEAYRAVIVGSAIYMGRWMAPAVRFLNENAMTLKSKPVALFTVCLTLKDRTDENVSKVAGYLAPVLEETKLEPTDSGLFAGRLASENLSPLYRTMAKQMGEADGDYRDWSAISTWAQSLPAKLGMI